eukprot:jgi/Botrbrau1/21583/Bobra.0898s0001.1
MPQKLPTLHILAVRRRMLAILPRAVPRTLLWLQKERVSEPPSNNNSRVAASHSASTSQHHLLEGNGSKTASSASTAVSQGLTQSAGTGNKPLDQDLLEKAREAAERKHFRTAATIYQQLLDSFGPNKEVWLHLAALYCQVGRPDLAIPAARAGSGGVPFRPRPARSAGHLSFAWQGACTGAPGFWTRPRCWRRVQAPASSTSNQFRWQ